jgi:hypothetical protein
MQCDAYLSCLAEQRADFGRLLVATWTADPIEPSTPSTVQNAVLDVTSGSVL